MRKGKHIAGIAAGAADAIHGPHRGVGDVCVRPASAIPRHDRDASAAGGASSRQAGFTLIEAALAAAVAAGIAIGFMIIQNQNARLERDRASARTFQQAVDAAYSYFTEQIVRPAIDPITDPAGFRAALLAAPPAPRGAANIVTRGVWPTEAETNRAPDPRAVGLFDTYLPNLEWGDMLMGNGNPLWIATAAEMTAAAVTRDVDGDGTDETVAGPGLDAAEAGRRGRFFNVWAEMDDMGEAQRVRALLGGGAQVLDNPPRVLLSAAVPGTAAAAQRFLRRDCPAVPALAPVDPGCLVTGQMTFDPDAVLAMRGDLNLEGDRARLNVGADAVVDFDPASRVEGTMTFESDATLAFDSHPTLEAIDFGARNLDNAGVITADFVDVQGEVDAEDVETGVLFLDPP